MRTSHLDNLRCPDTLSELKLNVTSLEDDDVLEGSLNSPNTVYAIRSGIPSFFPEQDSQTQTIRSFSEKWTKHNYYRKHTAGFYTEWYLQRYDFGTVDGLKTMLKSAKFILDAGTGAGRDAANFAQHSSATVYAVDTAWDALVNASQEPELSQVAFLHADINHLPLPDEFFDFINCDQVIHHTPDPRTTFENLRRKLKPGGQICCYVYRKKAVIREFVDDYVRDRIKSLPIDDALEISNGFTHLGKTLSDLNITIEIDEDIPILGIKKGKMDLQRFIHWNVMKCFWNDDFDFFTNNIVNYDWYSPEFCFRFEPEEFRGWFADGWEILAWDEQDAGISCRARKV